MYDKVTAFICQGDRFFMSKSTDTIFQNKRCFLSNKKIAKRHIKLLLVAALSVKVTAFIVKVSALSVKMSAS